MTDLLEYLGLEVTFPEHFLHYFLRRDGRGLIRHHIFCEITYSPENIVAIVSDRKRTQDRTRDITTQRSKSLAMVSTMNGRLGSGYAKTGALPSPAGQCGVALLIPQEGLPLVGQAI